MDDDGSGTLEHHELLAALQASRGGRTPLLVLPLLLCTAAAAVHMPPRHLTCPRTPQAARIPADADSIGEMIRLMDANHDGCIGWGEFEAFMREELAAGKHLLSGEYVLPSGARALQPTAVAAASCAAVASAGCSGGCVCAPCMR